VAAYINHLQHLTSRINVSLGVDLAKYWERLTRPLSMDDREIRSKGSAENQGVGNRPLRGVDPR
jgi:hypothetical protein